jgi:hemerythrin-like domain-containing protein
MNTPLIKYEAPAVVQHAHLEFQTLGHFTRALKEAIRTELTIDDPPRRLATVRFVMSSLQQYVERLFAMEEHDGYFAELAGTRPELVNRIKRLGDEHNALRKSLRQIVTRLDLLPAEDVAAFESICKEIVVVIGNLDQHTHAEIQLLEDAYMQDTGGEGGT